MTTTPIESTDEARAPDNIGEMLRLAREQKGISIPTAAMQTRLSQKIIENLEKNAFREIGASIFTRGYLINYGRFLGLDTALLSDIFKRTQQTETELHISSANAASQYRSFRHSRWKVWLKVIPLLLLAGVLAVQVFNPDSWLMMQFRAAFSEQGSGHGKSGADPVSPDIVIQIGSHAPSAGQIAPEVEAREVPELTSLASAEENDMPNEDTQPFVALTASEVETEHATEAAAPAAPASAVETSSANNNTEAVAEPVEVAAATDDAIHLHVSDTNWIEIRNKNHKIVQSKTFQKGDDITLPAADAPYEMNIGRPGAATLRIGNRSVVLADYRVSGNRRLFRVGEAQ